VTSVTFRPDGKIIASSSSDNTVRLWDASSGAQVGEPLKGHSGAVISVAFSPDGKIVASGSEDKTLRMIANSPI
jgi:WD40 repeat protein